jgi:replicative superfamily II helicase
LHRVFHALHQERALEKALVLYHWISAAPTKEIEEAHHLFFGAIKKMGEEFSWLVEAISTLAKKDGQSRSPIE